jgi:hypothetical protein
MAISERLATRILVIGKAGSDAGETEKSRND